MPIYFIIYQSVLGKHERLLGSINSCTYGPSSMRGFSFKKAPAGAGVGLEFFEGDGEVVGADFGDFVVGVVGVFCGHFQLVTICYQFTTLFS